MPLILGNSHVAALWYTHQSYDMGKVSISGKPKGHGSYS